MKKMIVLLSTLLLIPGCTWFSKDEKIATTHKTRVKLVILDEALEEYRKLTGSYPADLQHLVDGPEDPELKKDWDKSLLPQECLVDGWSQEFVYKVSPEGTEPPYELYSVGAPKAVN